MLASTALTPAVNPPWPKWLKWLLWLQLFRSGHSFVTPYVVLCDQQPENLSRFIEFTVTVSPAFDCALVSHGHIPQMAYVPCSVEALIWNIFTYFHILQWRCRRCLQRRKRQERQNSTAQGAPRSLHHHCHHRHDATATGFQCDCQYLCHAPRIVPQFRSFQPSWFECVEAVKIMNAAQGGQSGKCWCHGEISFRLCSW